MKKSIFLQVAEFSALYPVILISIILPHVVVKIMATVFVNVFYFLIPRRYSIALQNLRNAFKEEKSEKEMRKTARRCARSFFLLAVEMFKMRELFKHPHVVNAVISREGMLRKTISKAKKLHDESGGCIFVTPHIGNWEILPYASSLIGIPLVVTVRPLDNTYLEQYLYANRIASGQVIIPRKNAFLSLKETLRKGKSIGLLPDQSTTKGISVPFFGRMATVTPVPAILSIWYKKPIVVVACCKRPDDRSYEGIVCDPIWPREDTSEKEEIYRLTEAMNQKMESVIRMYPDQYIWFHNRWKVYKGSRRYLT